MPEHEPAQSPTTAGLTVSPGLDMVVEAAQVPAQRAAIDLRVLRIAMVAVALGVAAAFTAQMLLALIAFVTNLAFYGRFSLEEVSPAAAVAGLGWWVFVIPIVGALIVGVMARFGSKAIRGHGIPEAMEQVLTKMGHKCSRPKYVGRPESASTAVGSAQVHAREQAELVAKALGL